MAEMIDLTDQFDDFSDENEELELDGLSEKWYHDYFCKLRDASTQKEFLEIYQRLENEASSTPDKEEPNEGEWEIYDIYCDILTKINDDIQSGKLLIPQAKYLQ